MLACNEDTLVSFAADAGARACPGAQGFSLLDCLRPLQFDAGVQVLTRRPETEKMHLGLLTRAEACASPASALAAALCADAAEYSMEVPVAAAMGSTSLVRYQFLPGYGCLSENSLAGEGPDKVLSRAAAPNRVVVCPSVAHGAHARVDAYTCGVVCDAGFELQAGACVSQCAGLNATCEPGYAAEVVCVQGPQTLYNCSACPPRAGFGGAPFDSGAPYECQYAACAAGTRSVVPACSPCAPNTVSNASETSSCAACDTLGTGLYQRPAGQTACHAWHAVCPAGRCCNAISLQNTLVFTRSATLWHTDGVSSSTAIIVCRPKTMTVFSSTVPVAGSDAVLCSKHRTTSYATTKPLQYHGSMNRQNMTRPSFIRRSTAVCLYSFIETQNISLSLTPGHR